MDIRETADTQKKPHTVTLENRKTLVATGINRIISYDSAAASLETPFGTLTIGGQDITVSELSVQTGEVRIGGSIEFLQYTAQQRERGFFYKSAVHSIFAYPTVRIFTLVPMLCGYVAAQKTLLMPIFRLENRIYRVIRRPKRKKHN